MSLGGTLHFMTRFPDLCSIDLSNSSFRPNLRFRCIDPGFSRFIPLSSRSIVDVPIESRCAWDMRDAGAKLPQSLVDICSVICRTKTSSLAPCAHEFGLVSFGVCRSSPLAHLEFPASCQEPVGILTRLTRHFVYIIENEAALVGL